MKLELSQLITLVDNCISYRLEELERAEENERFKSYNSLSDDEKQSIKNQFRDPMMIPLAAHKLNQILAYQRDNRTEWRVSAKQDPADEIKAVIGGVQFKDLEDRCKMKYLQSDVYDSGLTVDTGVFKIYLDYDDNYNLIPFIKHVDYDCFGWDHNAREYALNDSLYMYDIEKLYRFEVREKYGSGIADSVSESGVEYYEKGAERARYYITQSADREFDIITIIHLSLKVLREEYVVTFNDYLNLFGNLNKPIAGKFESKKEAEYLYRGMQLKYVDNGYPLPSGGVKKQSCWRIDNYDFTIEKLISYEKTQYKNFPYAIYRSFHFENSYWTLTDMVKAAQKYLTKMLQQIDFAIGKDIKTGFELDINKIEVGTDEAITILQQGGILPVNQVGAVNPLSSKGANQQWFTIASIMQTLIEDLLGGRSFQGLQEKAGESGRAIALKQEQGRLSNELYLDNLSRTMVDLGEKLIEWFRLNDTQERILRVAGEKINPQMLQMLEQMGIYTPSQTQQGVGYLSINKNMKHLEDAQISIKIGQAALSNNEKERRLLQLDTLQKSIPGINQVPEFQDVMMEVSELDYDTRMKIAAGLQQQRQLQQQMALLQLTEQTKPNNTQKVKK